VANPIKIRPAVSADSEAIIAIRGAAILAIPPGHWTRRDLKNWAAKPHLTSLRKRIADNRVLVAGDHTGVLACAGLHLGSRGLVGLFVAPTAQGSGLGERMVAGIERLAVQYGLLQLKVCAAEPTIDFYHARGYRKVTGSHLERDPHSGMPSLSMHRKFGHRQTRFGRTLATLGQHLGIPADYGVEHKLRIQPECHQTVSIGKDVVGRPVYMEPRAARAWLAMQTTAMNEGIRLQAVSAYRTVAYQTNIFRKKLAAGQKIDEILQVSAAPGFSEHHSGRALDITTPGFEPLEEEFEQSPAYQWLLQSADRYNFRLSYPYNNRHRLAYEPWHWCFNPGQ